MSPQLGPKAADLNMEEHIIVTQIINLFYKITQLQDLYQGKATF